MDITRYKNVLREIRNYLASYGEKEWVLLLDEWLAELDDKLSIPALLAHVDRSARITGGMGSLRDLYISPENGHLISDNLLETSRASERLWSMTAHLYQEAIAIHNAIRPDEPFRR